jgi:hypothetical protein
VELDPLDRQWLSEAGVPLDDPRVRPVQVPGAGIGLDVDGGGGLVQIRFDASAVTVAGARVLEDAAAPNGVRVEFPPGTPADPSNWLPWYFAAGPAELVGSRFDDVGMAVTAALYGRTYVPGVWIHDPAEFTPYERRGDPT